MARRLRLEFAGACYHVINRGNYRRDLFNGKGAAESFQQCLFETCGRFGWRLHAFVIMRNHFHLAVETPEPNLSDGMKWLQGTWAMRFNRFRGEAGRPFQGRYKALHVEPGHALAQVAHYIHLNPVRAKVFSAERLLEYPWSSLPVFAGKIRPPCMVPATVLEQSGGLPDTPGGWRRYLDHLGVLAEDDAKRREEKFGRLSRGWVVGSAEFKAELNKELMGRSDGAERFNLAGADGVAQREIRAAIWEEKLHVAAKALRIPLEKLPEQYSAPGKVQLAAIMKRATSVANGWLADRLQMGKPASVSQYVRRFEARGGGGTKEFKAALSKVET